jgi:hypothetical protein
MYLRNAHPKKTVYLPTRPGWWRVLRPAVTTSVPTALLHTSTVRQLLLNRLVDVVDGAAWDADIRQRRTANTDMARAVARAEQAAAGANQATPRPDGPALRAPCEWLKMRWAEGATGPEISAESGRRVPSVPRPGAKG